jgi:HlyD family secretion protein
LVAAVWALLVWRTSSAGAKAIEYQTKPVERGDLRVTVTATGTLDALNSVEVGAEITGKVLEVNVEFNDRVEKGQVLATIDTETYTAQVDEARARLAAAGASLANSKASATEAKQKALRLKRLHEKGLTSDQDLESAMAAYERAKAAVQSDAAQVTLGQASLKVSESNVGKAIIRSPIDGIVLDRSVEVGQTVTSGLQTPVLFVLATDLTAMRLEVSIDEADVGMVKVGQPAIFTVDAYAGQEFESKVLAVKNMPTTDSSVVTYEAWLSADNEKRLLRPGMTATAHIVVSSKENVLLVPNAALRFTPPTANEGEKFSVMRILPGRRRRGGGSKGEAGEESNQRDKRMRTVWVLDGMGTPQAVKVETGATDGTNTEVKSKQLKEGAQAIVNAIETTEQHKP